MTKLHGRSAASALIAAGLGMRMFWGLAVDYPLAMNASWICPILGLLVFLPLGFAIEQASKTGSGSVWDNLTDNLPTFIVRPLEGILALLLMYDTAVNVRLLASSSNLIALNDVTVHILIFPLALAICIVVLLGGDAAGHSARIWLKILPLFLLILLIVQAKAYRIGWITPILGGGAASIIQGSIYCAGCFALASLTWIIAIPDRCKRGILLYTCIPGLVVSALMVIQHMSFPAMINIPFTRAARIELVLSNGRMSLSPQLLLDILWFGGLLQLISAEAVTAAAYLYKCLKGAKRWIITTFLSFGITLAAIFNPAWLRESAKLMQLVFLFIGGLFVILLSCAKLRKEVNISEKA